MKRRMIACERGYTLIELMIVVAIMAILASIALPQYQNYLVRSKVTEALTDLEAAKAAVTEAYGSANNSFPGTASPPISTSPALNAKYVTAVAYNSSSGTSASVVLTLGGTNNRGVDGQLVGIFGTGGADGTVSWQCGTATTPTDTVAGAQTALYPYIPIACRN